ncbi:transmembrane protein 141 isoform X2 [Papio anubis]|uniref:transmembrane protein 141 isoform X2 n=1 Tax=Papio anubis TaxID=9555 RepID=UPI0012AD80BB|nr:transmembrane protein 141 isoform X2 [Papio anubis]
MVNLGLSRVDDAVAARHPVGCVQVPCGWERTHPRAPPWLPSRGRQVTCPQVLGAWPVAGSVASYGVTRVESKKCSNLWLFLETGQLPKDMSTEPSFCHDKMGTVTPHHDGYGSSLSLSASYRSAKPGELRPGHRGLGAVGVWNTAFMPPDPRLTLPTP